MRIDGYTARQTRRDTHPWRRMVTAVSALGLTLGLATACDDDRATNPTATPLARTASTSADNRTRFPDGRIVFLADSIAPDGERVRGVSVSVMNPDGTGVVRLTPFGSFYGATWSRDRKRIAFADEGSGMIGVMNANGRGLHWVARGGHPSWSPDGQRIVFSRASGFENSDLYMVNADGTGEVKLTNTSNLSEVDPAWSPNGRFIAFVGVRTGREIFLMGSDGGVPTQLTNCAGEEMGCRSPEWGPRADSLAIAYIAQGADLAQLRILDGTTGKTVSLANDLPGVSGPGWSPDGRRLVFGSRRETPGRQALYSVDIATDVVRRVSLGAGEQDPSWR
jgi:Tol biopolymer transport system component